MTGSHSAAHSFSPSGENKGKTCSGGATRWMVVIRVIRCARNAVIDLLPLRQGFAWQRSALQLGRCGGGTQRVPGPLQTSPMVGVWGGESAPNPHPKV